MVINCSSTSVIGVTTTSQAPRDVWLDARAGHTFALQSRTSKWQSSQYVKGLAKHGVDTASEPGAPIFEQPVPCEASGTNRVDIRDPWYDLKVCPTEPAPEVAAGFVANQPGPMDNLARADRHTGQRPSGFPAKPVSAASSHPKPSAPFLTVPGGQHSRHRFGTPVMMGYGTTAGALATPRHTRRSRIPGPTQRVFWLPTHNDREFGDN